MILGLVCVLCVCVSMRVHACMCTHMHMCGTVLSSEPNKCHLEAVALCKRSVQQNLVTVYILHREVGGSGAYIRVSSCPLPQVAYNSAPTVGGLWKGPKKTRDGSLSMQLWKSSHPY